MGYHFWIAFDKFWIVLIIGLLLKEQIAKYDRASFMMCDQVRANFNKLEEFTVLNAKYSTK